MNSRPVVLVTGSSRGLGRGIAICCARAGLDVAIHYASNEAAAQETSQLCQSVALNNTQQFLPFQANIGMAIDRIRLFEQLLARFGRLDALVNNAGMAPRVRADITETGEESYDEVMNVNLKGPYFLSQLAARHWLKHPDKSLLPGGYKLLFITSISADTASINRGEYCLSKAGLAMAVQLWATRLANEGVQVFEIRPGIMETDMTSGVKDKYNKLIAEGLVPQKRWGTPEDVGLAVESILNGAFPFSTGQVISVDGGFHLKRL
ncbi:3-ketoacyl-ACP reductase [Pedosphaera parvula]|uniref:Short-chain dehydrogenase/reductase SDR n=1 Tax=Pedosphaera parvula (strain Ellin514) TaxID=320771 RepID=B9XB64_PEDPL|nr:3-ketoacyl-ACP reductase [Pedosphaera parvula]EEF62749.1 short-chain dehydrogenase/reductase SDR [Pedosphaera parvula Ellin514]